MATIPLSIPQKRFSSALGAVPDTLTAVTTSDSFLTQILLANITGSAATITITNGSNVAIMEAVSLPANSTSLIVFPDPLYMASGVKWQAGTASAINGSASGYVIGY